MNPKEAGVEQPPQAAEFLSPEEIVAVSDYVTANMKGKGKPDRADCVAFWGEEAKQCRSYK